MKEYHIKPCPAPRMTRSDKWKKRPCVMRYFAFRDEVRLNNVSVEPYGSHIIFYMPMPKSWSKKKKSEMINTLHQQTPDIDNLLKALFDSIFKDDSHVADIRASKVWAESGSILIK